MDHSDAQQSADDRTDRRQAAEYKEFDMTVQQFAHASNIAQPYRSRQHLILLRKMRE
jgi:hypothetical protein